MGADRGPVRLAALAALLGSTVALGLAQDRPTDWRSHNIDTHNTRYAELDQIDTTTVDRLELDWSFELEGPARIAQVTPLVADGVMYLHSMTEMLALDAVTGQQLWSRELDPTLSIEERGSGPVRGPTFADGRIYAYTGSTLYAMEGDTGRPVESFGAGGALAVVAEALQLRYPDAFPPTLDPVSIGYRLTTPPAYSDGTLYVAAALSEGHIPGGLVIAVDATTGAIEWVFNTVPQGPQDEGWEIARDTWGTGARAGGGVWTQPAVDDDLGMVYINAGNPSPDYDGSARHGMNLFTNSTIALDKETGELEWYYQAVHHDLWDWDHVSGPVLFDVTRDSRIIKGVAAGGKNCLFYLWDRETGDPIHPMVETTVPTETDVPGEQVWPTQPIPHTARGVPMTPFCATFVNLDDPELARQTRQMYTPYSVDEHYIVAHGGASFGSPSFSPRTGLLYITGKNGAVSLTVEPVGDSIEPGPDSRGHTENYSEIDRITPAYTPTETVTAYDPVTGEQVWQEVVPAVSSIGSSGNMVTAGDVVFQGTGAGTFFAFDAWSGDQLLSYDAPRPIRASPLTYEVGGRQYVTVVATNTILTFSLP